MKSRCAAYQWPPGGARRSSATDIWTSSRHAHAASLHFLVGVYFVNKTDRRVELSWGEGFQLPSNFPFVSMAATARSALVLLPLLLVLLPVWRTLAVSGAPPPQAHEASGPAEGSSNSNSSVTTAAAAGKEGRTLSGFNADSSMVQRALYVLVAITAFGLLYFLIRAVR